MSHFHATAALALALALAAPGCSSKVMSDPAGATAPTPLFSSAPTETETIPARRVEVGDNPRIVVDNRVGRVAVSAGGDGVVEIEAEKHAATKEELAEIKLVVEAKDDVVTIKWGSDEKVVVNRSLDITIKAPAGAALRLYTGNGPITVEGFKHGAEAKTGVGPVTVKGVTGDLTLATGNGAITAEEANGTVKAESGVGAVTVKGSKGARTVRTGNGPILIDGADGAVSARADLGRIEVRNTKGDLTLHTGNGPIRVDDADGGLVAETGVGAVEVSGRFAGDCRIKTGNGQITVAIPEGSALKVDASTGNGAITNEFNLPVDGFVSLRSKGNVGDGSGGSLRLETGVGSIRLRKR